LGWSTLPVSEADELLAGRSANILVMDDVPHDWLLPRCKTILHHGGAGTTAAGLRGGIPNLVIPFAADQPFWGARVHALGAGPQPVPVWHLTTEKLVAALLEAERDAVRNGAQAAGRKIREENGVVEAVKVIEDFAFQR
jgi:UDP:flavonoid glycosyltransferase YjiC (YdhE family)